VEQEQVNQIMLLHLEDQEEVLQIQLDVEEQVMLEVFHHQKEILVDLQQVILDLNFHLQVEVVLLQQVVV
jgi:hypothetical protein